jgi:hypothetical protein
MNVLRRDSYENKFVNLFKITWGKLCVYAKMILRSNRMKTITAFVATCIAFINPAEAIQILVVAIIVAKLVTLLYQS